MGKPPADRTTAAVCAFLALAGISCERAAEPTPPRPQPQVITTKSGIEMVAIPASWRQIGSRSGKPDEAPVHNVWLDAFLIDRTEITQEHYGKFVLGNPSHFKGPTRPVEQVSWADAALYCNKRSRAEGLEPCYDEETAKCSFEANGYRLPTEAEWEYACRAGTDTKYYFGRESRRLSRYAWYGDNAFKKTHPVGRKRANPWGLYDMLGNVREWCNDVYDRDYIMAFDLDE